MPDNTKPNRKPDVNTDMSEYVWDIKTRRFKHNPYYRPGNSAAQYVFWGAVVLILAIAVVWCLRSSELVN